MNKKIFRSAFYAFGAAALLSGFASCSDDKVETSTIDLDNKVLTDGITTEIDGDCVTLDVTSNSKWTITVDADSAWIGVSDSVGNGNKTVAVFIDPMFGSSTSRKAKLLLRTADVEKVVNVEQKPTYEGQAVANDDESTQMLLIASNKGLGCGFSFSGKKMQTILNDGALRKLINKGTGEFDYLAKSDTYSSLEGNGARIDSVERKKDKLGVSVQLDISYASFKMTVGGKYHGDETKNHLKETYNYAGKFNIASASVQMPDIIALYNDAKAGTGDYDKETLSIMKGLLSIDFGNKIKAINNYYANNDTVNAHTALKALIGKYGFGIITSAELGAMLEMSMKFDLDSLHEDMGIDSAKLQAGVQNVLSFGANASMDYQNIYTKVFDNSAYSYSIKGGDSKEALALDKLYSSKRFDGDGLAEKIQDQLVKWKSSISADDKKTIVNTNVTLTYIWNFLNEEVQGDAEDFVNRTYKAQIDKLFPDGLEGDMKQ